MLSALLGFAISAASAEEVVVYTSQDEMYSAPIIKAFEQASGIRVKAAYDTEASKTTGLVNRLLAEKDRPRADVFWNGELTQTILLKTKGVLAPYVSPQAAGIPARFKDPDGYWTGFGARARVIIYNTDLVTTPPVSIFDLTQPQWKAQAGIALPLFGSSATHAAILFQALGKERAEQFYRDLKANQVKILDGNATVRDMVAQGELKLGITDTDDANGAVLDKRPVKWLFPDQEEGQIGTAIFCNSVALIKNGPHPDAGRKFIDFTLRPQTEEELAKSRAVQIPVRATVPAPDSIPKLNTLKILDVDYAAAAAQMSDTAKFIQEVFAR